MMRLALSPAASGLLRALLQKAGDRRDRLLLTDCKSVDWQSLTFIGERHQLRLRIPGQDAARTAGRLIEGLAETEFTIPGNLVADITAEGPRALPDGSIEVTIEALTVAT